MFGTFAIDLARRGVEHFRGRLPLPSSMASYSVRRIPLSRVSRWASATGMIVTSTIRKTTTLTCGSCWPRRIWPKIQIGSVLLRAGGERRHDHLVEREREREQAAGDERRRDRRERDVAERLDAVGAEVHRRLGQRAGHAPQPRDHVVVDDDDAERRVADHDRPETEVELPVREVRVERHAGDDPGQRDRQHEQERDRPRARRSGSGARRTTRPTEHERDPVASAAPSARARAPAACRGCGSPAQNHFVVKPGIGQLCTFDELNA